ncbi:MAG: hypothetical protein HYR76_11040 [Ignavibacteria bacterium]|nr:hypothetical protein [Ignavibacteria bacterium]
MLSVAKHLLQSFETLRFLPDRSTNRLVEQAGAQDDTVGNFSEVSGIDSRMNVPGDDKEFLALFHREKALDERVNRVGNE